MSAPRRALLVGPGQLGRVLAGGLVACGVSIDVVRRGEPIAPTAAHDLVLIAVGEKDLDAVLAALPTSHRGRVVLLQNELVPATWRAHGVLDPTVLVVWFEKKAGRAAQVVRTTPVAGPHAELFVRAMVAMDLPAEAIASAALVAALVVKNLYIVGANALGLRLGGTTGGLATTHRDEAERVLRELLAIERTRLCVDDARGLDDDALIARTFEAFLADPAHGAVGRTAKERLARALARGRAARVSMPALETLAASCG
jgi:ketopantoate reductase